MSVSIRYITAGALLSLLSGVAFAGDCCGSGSFTGGITNIPVVSGNGSCCGTANSQIVGVPGIYVPSSNVGVNVGGTYVGGTNYNVGGTVIGGNNVVVGGNTYMNSGASYGSYSSGGGVAYYGGGGGAYMAPAPVYNGMIEGLNVGGGQAAASMEQVTETKTVTEIVPIRAVCMDDTGVPHPASRVNGDEKVGSEFNGEVYRCMAGTYMEVTMGRMVDGKAVFDGGKNLTCTKGQALSYKGGNITCVAQLPAANCNERSLLRRFGPGIKYLVLARQQTYTRQVQSQQSSQYTTFKSSMYVDGGVGQGVY